MNLPFRPDTTTEDDRTIRNGGGMRSWVTEAMNHLMPILGPPLPGDSYITDDGRPDFTAMRAAPHSHITDITVGLLVDLWTGRSLLMLFAARADQENKNRLALALRAIADGLEERP